MYDPTKSQFYECLGLSQSRVLELESLLKAFVLIEGGVEIRILFEHMLKKTQSPQEEIMVAYMLGQLYRHALAPSLVTHMN